MKKLLKCPSCTGLSWTDQIDHCPQCQTHLSANDQQKCLLCQAIFWIGVIIALSFGTRFLLSALTHPDYATAQAQAELDQAVTCLLPDGADTPFFYTQIQSQLPDGTFDPINPPNVQKSGKDLYDFSLPYRVLRDKKTIETGLIRGKVDRIDCTTAALSLQK